MTVTYIVHEVRIMKRVACPECGRHIRPCNMTRHRAATHFRRPQRKALACPANDPTCPCNDGDVCNYADHEPTGTKGWPMPRG